MMNLLLRISSVRFSQSAHINKSFSDMVLDIPVERTRNFCIIAHIDHGKSTIADRLMEYTGAIQCGGPGQQLDKLQVERERGITVKAQTVSLIYKYPKTGLNYLLNLIDTPGHVDFAYEVSRSMAACQGAVLVIDATQGIQAQTIANFDLSTEEGLELVPVLNKIDLPHADVDECKDQLTETLGFSSSEIVCVSAKSGLNIEKLFEALIHTIPAPPMSCGDNQRLLLFDSWFDRYRGVISLVAVQSGVISTGDILNSYFLRKQTEIAEIGIVSADGLLATKSLYV